MRADRARAASTPFRIAGAALVSILLAGCSGSGLENLEVGNPSYASPSSAAQAETAKSSGIVPLTTEQEQQMGDAGANFVPMSRPTGAEAAVEAATAPQTAPAPSDVATATPAPAQADTPVQTATASPAAQIAAPAVTQTASTDMASTAAAGFAPTSAPTEAVKKKGFLAGFFSQKPQDAPVMSKAPAEAPKPVIKLASAAPVQASLTSLPAEEAEAAPRSQSLGSDLPGVRKSSLFEITRKDSLNDDSDVDIHEAEEALMQLASAAGMARLAPNGLLKQRESVDVSCLKPSLVRMLKQIEGHYGKRMVVTSGYRSPAYNRRVRGARKSMHMYCAAVDVQIDGVSKWELARYTRSMPGRGGVGTYCHTESVHIDIGPERDWNWRCRRRR